MPAPVTRCDPFRLTIRMAGSEDVRVFECDQYSVNADGSATWHLSPVIDLAGDEYRVAPLPAERRALVKWEGSEGV